jgi:uncharacterized membrane protein
MPRATVDLYLPAALRSAGGNSTNYQERIQLYLQHLVFVTLLLLSAAIVEELEPVSVCCGCRTSTHHQERIQLYLQHLVLVTLLLLSATIVEELEPV